MIKPKVKENLLIFFSFVLMSVLVSMLFTYPDWDFFSYHYYNGWALWNNRINIDIMPCLFRTYFNPILDGFVYLMLKHLNNFPALFVFIMSLKYAVLMFIAYKFYDYIFKESCKEKFIAILFCIILAGASPIIIYCTSFDNTDIYGAIGVLLGLLFILKYLFKSDSIKRNCIIFLSLVLCGAFVGLKYTNMPCVAGLFVATLLLIKKVDKPFKTLGIMMAGATLGLLLTDGYWMYLLWKNFKNPFFPYFNEIFKSPMANTDSILAKDFGHLRPESILGFILMPFNNPKNFECIGFENLYFDLKIILGFISIILIFCTVKIKDFQQKISEIIDVRILYFLGIFTIFSYYINLALFGNVRYLLVLFIVLPVFICVFCRQLVNQNIYKYVLLVILFLFCITYKLPSNFNGIIGFGNDKVIKIEDMHIEDDSTVLCSTFITAFIAPFQNSNIRYVGFVLPQDLIEKGYYNTVDLKYKNKYYSSDYLVEILPQIISESKNLYIVLSVDSLGPNYIDLKLYENALSRYSNGKINKIINCKKIDHFVFGENDLTDELKLCKLK